MRPVQRRTYLKKEVQVGYSGEHLEQEDWQEGNEVRIIFGCRYRVVSKLVLHVCKVWVIPGDVTCCSCMGVDGLVGVLHEPPLQPIN
jgi:hypothetical protein